MARTDPPAAASRSRRREAAPVELTVAEQVCLALVAEGHSHGWAIGTVLAPDGEVGRAWTLTRALTYRAIDGLVDKGLVNRKAQSTGTGRDRALLTITAAGRRATEQWLDEPVEHLRDVRTLLLVKVLLRDRAGVPVEPLLRAQLEVFAPAIDALTAGPDGDIVNLWRREHARAVRRFLQQALEPATAAAAARPEMRLSARNQLRGQVVGVQRGELMASVKAVLGDGQTLTATITQEATDDLDIATGDDVVMIVKATEVMVAKAGDAAV